MDEPPPRAHAPDFDLALTRRLAEVISGANPTEGELRVLAEEGTAFARALQASIVSSEARLSVLVDDPAATVTEIAAELRRVERLRGELDDLAADLRVLDRKARALRGKWLGRDGARSG